MAIVKLHADEVPPEAAARLNQATLLGSVGFASLWQTCSGRPVCWVSEQQGDIGAVLAGLEFGPGWLTTLQTMPDGLYSRAIVLDCEIDIQKLASELLAGIASAGYARVFINDYYRLFHPGGAWKAVDSHTVLVDIGSGGWVPPDKKVQSEIRKAEREGLTIQRFEESKHMGPFLQLMKHTERRHGRSPKYPEAFFRALARLAESDPRIRWLIVEHEGKAAASHIYFVEGSLLLNWQVYFDKGFSFLKPNQYMTWCAATEAASQGVRYLNMGASPPDADSLKSYKLKWGGRDFTYPVYQRTSVRGRLIGGLRR